MSLLWAAPARWCQAQEAPRRFVPAADASAMWAPRNNSKQAAASRPLAQPGSNSRSTTETTGNLNWRPRHSKPSYRPVRTTSAAGPELAPATGQPAIQQHDSAPRRLDAQVQQAAQLEPIEPLQDPFGDRTASHPEPAPAPPLRLEPSVDAATGPALELPPSEEYQSVRQIEPMPMPPPAGDDGGLSQLLPRPFEMTYCQTPGACEVDRKTLRQLGNSFLDITPSLEPNVADPHLERQSEYLSTTESRDWKDRRLQTIAVGRMVDYKNGRIVIEPAGGGEPQQVSFESLSDDDLCYVTAMWRLPKECTLGDDEFQGRDWIASTFTWKASGLCHKPLYFEDHKLERYGHTAGPILQPALSGAHFFLNIAVLPYKMGMNPPNECRYALGYYRPGSCAPWILDPVPLSLRGAVFQTMAVATGITAIP